MVTALVSNPATTIGDLPWARIEIRQRQDRRASRRCSAETPPPSATSAADTPMMALASIEQPKVEVAKIDARRIDAEDREPEHRTDRSTSRRTPEARRARHRSAAASMSSRRRLPQTARRRCFAGERAGPVRRRPRANRFPLLAASLALAAALGAMVGGLVATSLVRSTAAAGGGDGENRHRGSAGAEGAGRAGQGRSRRPEGEHRRRPPQRQCPVHQDRRAGRAHRSHASRAGGEAHQGDRGLRAPQRPQRGRETTGSITPPQPIAASRPSQPASSKAGLCAMSSAARP